MFSNSRAERLQRGDVPARRGHDGLERQRHALRLDEADAGRPVVLQHLRERERRVAVRDVALAGRAAADRLERPAGEVDLDRHGLAAHERADARRGDRATAAARPPPPTRRRALARSRRRRCRPGAGEWAWGTATSSRAPPQPAATASGAVAASPRNLRRLHAWVMACSSADSRAPRPGVHGPNGLRAREGLRRSRSGPVTMKREAVSGGGDARGDGDRSAHRLGHATRLFHERRELREHARPAARRRAPWPGRGASRSADRRRRPRRRASVRHSTQSRLPAACDGSTTTGRPRRAFAIGTAATSSVKRVAVSNVRMPRSHMTTLSLPSRSTYSAAWTHSSIVQPKPRLSMTGMRERPSAFSSGTFCMLRLPICAKST